MSLTRNFLEVAVEKYLEKQQLSGITNPFIRTRFPPEPNGYLHIGHAKSICINFGLAKKFGGKCNLRFDDTNPSSEDVEYVQSIQNDIKWLGFEWDEEPKYASDYFDILYDFAKYLISKGLAYVDSQTPEEIRINRGGRINDQELNAPGIDSIYRERSIEENLHLFEKMKNGDFLQSEVVLRAKIDMNHSNMNMRDPLLYRICFDKHHRTGSKWCIYPLYDFAHGQEDFIEQITHSICTLEFENHRELYNWFTMHFKDFAKEGDFLRKEKEDIIVPNQYEFARLNMEQTVMSKRKLLALVQTKVVDGWDDPRLPTICAFRRRGVLPSSIIKFCHTIGYTTSSSTISPKLFDDIIRDDLDTSVHRRLAVLEPLKLQIVNWKEFKNIYANLSVQNHPQNDDFGNRNISMSSIIYIDQSDFNNNPPNGYKRLTNDNICKLRYGPNIKVIKQEEDGSLSVEIVVDSKSKPSGVIHWVDSITSQNIHIYEYSNLLKENGEVDESGSLRVYKNALCEASVLSTDVEQKIERYQFERLGYYYRDINEHSGIRFNRIVGLKSSIPLVDNNKTTRNKTAEENRRDVEEKAKRLQIAPDKYFTTQTDKYSKFNDQFVPTHLSDGTELTKTAIKKLAKELDKHTKAYLKANQK